MIIYSVTVSIEADIREEWLKWVKKNHIPEVMATGYFSENHIQELIDPEPQEGTFTFNIQYHCANRGDYDLYMQNQAKVLQEKHNDEFAGKFVAFRTLLERL
ncbi:MAG: DUF4286 family protein [Bacteroidia bacterium]|nr:DUF4286 family protein [Bacteroidia bacterium]